MFDLKIVTGNKRTVPLFAVQFNVGIRDAKTIVSINSDENAYMSQMADYFAVADLKNFVPELEKALE